MRIFKRILVVLVCLCSGDSFAQNNDYSGVVEEFVSAVQTKNIALLAQKVVYPLKREYPLPAIIDAAGFEQRFSEVFDDSLQQMIAHSDVLNDWGKVGWRGIMFNNGDVWLSEAGKLIAVNYQSAREKNMRDELINKGKETLHESLIGYVAPVLVWETKRFKIRIDALENGAYRYAAWKKDMSQREKPDLILNNGSREMQGNMGEHYFAFKNGIYEYRLYVLLSDGDSQSNGYLTVLKNGRVILEEPLVKVLSD